MTETTSTSEAATPNATTGRKDRRRRRKMGAMPRPILPMRALWESASRESQERAHETGVWMLEYWLGRMSKAEMAEHVGVTPLRVWQLSQMAIAGMVCGLLPQPRYRRGMRVMATDPENDPKALKQKVVALERELEVAQQLIDILKTLPGNAGRELATPSERGKKETSASRRVGAPGRKKSARGKGSGKKRTTPPSGGRARGASSSTAGSATRRRGDRGTSSGGSSSDGAPLDSGSSETPGPSSA